MAALRGTPPPSKSVQSLGKKWVKSGLQVWCGAAHAVAVVFRVGLVSSHTSTVREIGALTNLDDVAVRIADVAADLAVLGDRLRNELGSSTLP
jgi:hypothetical protein